MFDKVSIEWNFFTFRGGSGGGIPREPLEKISAIFNFFFLGALRGIYPRSLP